MLMKKEQLGLLARATDRENEKEGPMSHFSFMGKKEKDD